MVFNKLILVSKESILKKHFGIDMIAYEKLSESEKEKVKELFPTDDENAFMEVYKSTAPQLARLQRKMSVCLDVEVLEYDFDFIVFTYAGNVYKLLAPKNAYRICKVLENENDGLEGLQELAKQGCLFVNDKSIMDLRQDKVLEVDEMQLLKKVSEKFFFQTFIV